MVREDNFPLLREQSLLYLLEIVKTKQPNRILEIGTCIGFSGISMLKQCAGSLTTIEIDEERAKQALQNFKNENLATRVNLIVGDATELLKSNKVDDRYDLIFLDGPKAQYIRQLPYLIELLNVGGVLVADNVLFRGYVEKPESAPKRFKTIVKRLNEFIDMAKRDHRLSDVRVEHIEDGLLIATKTKEDI